LWRGGVHLFGQRAKSDAPLFEVSHRRQKIRKRSAKPVQLPNDQTVPGLNESKGTGQTGAVATAPAHPIFKEVALIDTGGDERVSLQVKNLPVGVGRDPHVADQHVRKTSSLGFPHNAPFGQGLSCSFLG
jgi:hypothetical protein